MGRVLQSVVPPEETSDEVAQTATDVSKIAAALALVSVAVEWCEPFCQLTAANTSKQASLDPRWFTQRSPALFQVEGHAVHRAGDSTDQVRHCLLISVHLQLHPPLWSILCSAALSLCSALLLCLAVACSVLLWCDMLLDYCPSFE